MTQPKVSHGESESSAVDVSVLPSLLARGKNSPLNKQGKPPAPCTETWRASWPVCESAFVLLPDHLQILGRRVQGEGAPGARCPQLFHKGQIFPTLAHHPPVSNGLVWHPNTMQVPIGREHDIHGLWGQNWVPILLLSLTSCDTGQVHQRGKK